jgi:hypothetical protein
MAGGLAGSRFDRKSSRYSLVYSTGVGEFTAADICDAIKNATTTAGTLISLST